jgi:putative hydrolases of HD superfamily
MHSGPLGARLSSTYVRHGIGRSCAGLACGLGLRAMNEDALETTKRLAAQYAFLAEALKLAEIRRQTLLPVSRRPENDAEHSWHLCLMAITLAEHSNVPVDLARVLRMLIIHDLVEIDAGDTYAYDVAGQAGQHEREARAAERIFGLLPSDQAAALRAAWDEFEARLTPEARFAAALDRLQPVLLNLLSEGVKWREHGVTRPRVIARNAHAQEGSAALWAHALAMLDEAVATGKLPA